MSMRDTNSKKVTICEVLRQINDRLQGDQYAEIRDLLALSEHLAKRMSRKLLHYNRVEFKSFWDKNEEYYQKINREIDTYLIGNPTRAMRMLNKNNHERGICYIAFGENCDTIAAHTVALSAKNTSLPITVITNVEKCHPKWDKTQGINFIYVNMPIEKNREIKTQLYKYTPYDETLYIDCDSVIAKQGIEKIFDHFNGNDLILQAYGTRPWISENKFYRIYRDTAKKLDCHLPLNIYVGGIFVFRKSETTKKFFDTWNEYWNIMGCGRDMPSLACTMQKINIPFSTITKKDHRFFIFGDDPAYTIIHPLSLRLLSIKYGIPYLSFYKGFDKNYSYDWGLVYFDEPKIGERCLIDKEKKALLQSAGI
jgi:hypothetical protein